MRNIPPNFLFSVALYKNKSSITWKQPRTRKGATLGQLFATIMDLDARLQDHFYWYLSNFATLLLPFYVRMAGDCKIHLGDCKLIFDYQNSLIHAHSRSDFCAQFCVLRGWKHSTKKKMTIR